MCFGDSHVSHTETADFQRSPFWGSPVSLRSVTQNDQIRHGNQYGRACFRSITRHLRLHKCDARFVSDTAQFLVLSTARRHVS